MKTFPSETEARRALRKAKLNEMPTNIREINGTFHVTVLCSLMRDVEHITNNIGFDAQLEVAA